MDDVGNQTSCRLAGLRPGTVYFVQVQHGLGVRACVCVCTYVGVYVRVRDLVRVHNVVSSPGSL